MEENLSLWQKKSTDLTVGDSIKVTAAACVIATAAIWGVPVVIGGIMNAADKIRLRRSMKKAIKEAEGSLSEIA
jgi:transcription initiation factor TFIIIB Brf1 subunit/transcription initiation factor TFIIB